MKLLHILSILGCSTTFVVADAPNTMLNSWCDHGSEALGTGYCGLPTLNKYCVSIADLQDATFADRSRSAPTNTPRDARMGHMVNSRSFETVVLALQRNVEVVLGLFDAAELQDCRRRYFPWRADVRVYGHLA